MEMQKRPKQTKSVRVGIYFLPTVNPDKGGVARKNYEQTVHSTTFPLLRKQLCGLNVPSLQIVSLSIQLLTLEA